MNNLFKCAFALILGAGFVTTPVAAQSTVSTSASYSAHPQVAAKYEGAYVVIKANTPQETLIGIEEKLKKVGIVFKVNDVMVKDGLITKISVSVKGPGGYSGTVSSSDNSEPLTSPIYFYSEAGKVNLSSGDIPADISARGRLVVTDNLNGVAILYNNDSTEFSGSFTTKWNLR